jgi:hypothetical protein
MRHPLVWILFLGIVLAACQATTYERQEFAGIFKLNLPSYLSPIEGMHPDAVVQMGNPYRHIYLLVRYDSLPASSLGESETVPSLEDYYIETFQRLLPGEPVPYYDSLQVGGLNGLRVRVDSHHEGTDVTYDLSLLQGEQLLYQILSWTETDEMEQFEADQNTIVESFQEL